MGNVEAKAGVGLRTEEIKKGKRNRGKLRTHANTKKAQKEIITLKKLAKKREKRRKQ